MAAALGGGMKHETSKALYEYWLSCHRQTGVRAAGVRAAELASILPSLFLLDLDNRDPPAFNYRFCGASIATRYGRDLSEESFFALWGPSDASTLSRDIRDPAFRSSGMVAGVLAETMGSGFVSYEMLLLPLVGEKGAAGAIGSMVRVGGHDETNRIRGRIVAQSLRSIRFLPGVGVHPAARAPLTVDRPPPLQDKNQRRYRHLTVLNGGK